MVRVKCVICKLSYDSDARHGCITDLRAEVEQLQEQITMRKLADAGIGTVPIGIKLKAHLEAEVERLRVGSVALVDEQARRKKAYKADKLNMVKARAYSEDTLKAEVERLKDALDTEENRTADLSHDLNVRCKEVDRLTKIEKAALTWLTNLALAHALDAKEASGE